MYRALYEREPASVPHDALGSTYSFATYPGERAIVFADGPTVERPGDGELSPDRRRSMENFREKTVLSVPLRFGERHVGVLRLYDMHEERLVTEAELQLAQGLGEQAAIAIINARLFGRLDATQRRLGALLDAGRALTSSLVLEEVIDTVTRTGGRALASPRCILYEFDRASDTLTARAYAEAKPTPGYAEIGVPLPLAKMPGNRAILDARVPVVEQLSDKAVEKHTRAEMAHWGESTALNVPLFYKDEALGILMFLETEAEREFTPDELALAAGIGEQASIALQNARLFRRQEVHTQRLLGLLESSRAMTASLSARQTIDGMKAEISNLLTGVDCRVGVHLRNDDGAFEAYIAEGERRSAAAQRRPAGRRRRGRSARAEAPGAGRARQGAHAPGDPPARQRRALGLRRALRTARPALQRRRDRGRPDPRQPDGGGRREGAALREDRAPGHHRRADRALQPP